MVLPASEFVTSETNNGKTEFVSSAVSSAGPLELIIGSPIVAADGSAIAMMSGYRRGPLLTDHLPGWFLRDLARRQQEKK